MTYRIKVLDENNKIVDYIDFIDNLTIKGAPDYRNFNGQVGMTRLTSEKYYNELVIMYFYKDKQEDSYAEFITEEDAYSLCSQRNKLDVASELNICADNEVEVL